VEIVGIAVIGTLDVLVPAALAAWLIVFTVRRHRTPKTEMTFWFLTALALALPTLAGVNGILGIPVYEGGQVIPTTLFSFPGSLAAIIATVPLSGAFFGDGTWASLGYFIVMPLYLAGTVLWQLVVILGLRRIIQLGRRSLDHAKGRAPEGARPVA
jgi:hypothetical protein